MVYKYVCSEDKIIAVLYIISLLIKFIILVGLSSVDQTKHVWDAYDCEIRALSFFQNSKVINKISLAFINKVFEL